MDASRAVAIGPIGFPMQGESSSSSASCSNSSGTSRPANLDRILRAIERDNAVEVQGWVDTEGTYQAVDRTGICAGNIIPFPKQHCRLLLGELNSPRDYSAFQLAVLRQNVNVIDVFTNAPLEVINFQNSAGHTALHLLPIMYHETNLTGRAQHLLNTAQKLLNKGAGLNIRDNEGFTPLDHALNNDYQELVDLFLKYLEQRLLPTCISVVQNVVDAYVGDVLDRTSVAQSLNRLHSKMRPASSTLGMSRLPGSPYLSRVIGYCTPDFITRLLRFGADPHLTYRVSGGNMSVIEINRAYRNRLIRHLDENRAQSIRLGLPANAEEERRQREHIDNIDAAMRILEPVPAIPHTVHFQTFRVRQSPGGELS